MARAGARARLPVPSPARSVARLLPVVCLLIAPGWIVADTSRDETPRAILTARTDAGERVEMPLRKTRVRAEISAFVARVTVEQTFGNPLGAAIEARYVFPLPERAAVDGFVMTIGDRTIRGEIRRREEAAAVYREARQAGHAAALLEQERPNIFTQSVANIPPGGEIRVEISYVDFLAYESGLYRFNFPMVVGPRYFPGSTRRAGLGGDEAGDVSTARRVSDPRTARQHPPTDRVVDADRIDPPVLRPGFIPSSAVDLEIRVDTGTPLRSIASESHEIRVRRNGASRAVVRLARHDVIPNADFILKLGVASGEPSLGLLAHRTGGEGFFTLRLQPPAETSADEAAPKEIIFVVDVSGSMSGFPIEMSKRLMHRALASLGPRDTFNVVLFSSQPSPLAPASMPSTPEEVARGQKFVRKVEANGGTEMREALRAAFALPVDPARLRMVLLLTDGYVGNDQELFDVARTARGEARIFCLGVGTSVNHYLLREMAEIGRGAYTYVRPDGDAAAAVDRFNDWVSRPYLTDLEIDWGSLPVEDVWPERLPDLYSGQTLTVVGRYLWEGSETVMVRGRLGGRPWESSLDVNLPEESPAHGALASAWARERIRDLTVGAAASSGRDVEMQVTSLALAFRLMSPYTSFVAVDSTEIANPGAAPILWEQALAMPQHVSFEGCFGPAGPRRGPALGAHAIAKHDGWRRPEAITEMVEVVAHGGVVDTESAMSASAFSTELIEGLPIIGGNYQNLLTLTPGATGTEGDGNPNVQGARETGLQFRLDGGNVADPAAGVVAGVPGGVPGGLIADPPAGTFASNLNIGAIEEIEVIMAGAGAEYGGADGGFANIVTLAGQPGRAPERIGPDAGIELLALRVLADLADDGRLSRAEGIPALAALLERQHLDGRFSLHPRTQVLATLALAESAIREPGLPWLGEALALAASSWEVAVSPGAACRAPSAQPPAPPPGPWSRQALAALASCGSLDLLDGRRWMDPSPAVRERAPDESDTTKLLQTLAGEGEPAVGRLVARILDPHRPGLRCLTMR